MKINDIQEDYDVVYLKSFKTPRFIDKEEQDILEFEEIINKKSNNFNF